MKFRVAIYPRVQKGKINFRNKTVLWRPVEVAEVVGKKKHSVEIADVRAHASNHEKPRRAGVEFEGK